MGQINIGHVVQWSKYEDNVAPVVIVESKDTVTDILVAVDLTQDSYVTSLLPG